ncbi:MAG: hypothetical protein CVU88_04630 [Firmicutes bacterium HGW-Firmicutes-13]|nr:MAG: hypothetical protein CVU88_04630 [Firmicutes bacterium HGW-Firmicutes-13]
MDRKMSLHLISSENYDIGFHPETFKIFKIQKNEERTILEQDILKNKDSQMEINKNFLDTYSNYEGVPMELFLLVSQKCNLSCKYCYASHGTYKNEGIMEFSTAKKAIEVFYKKFPVGIKSIIFFGGEPLLNFHLIKQVCEFLEDYCNERDAQIPNFTIITNGTIYSDEIKKVLNHYKIELAISMDGPKEIHDQLRVFPDKSGSHDLILKNLSKFNKDRKYSLATELTFTKKHIIHNFIDSSIISYFMDLGVDRTVTSFVLMSPDDLLYDLLNIDEKTIEKISEYISNDTKKMITSWCGFNPLCSDLMNVMIDIIKQQNGTRSFCPAGISKVAMGWDGDIYPCQILIDRKEFYMGNIYDEDFPNNQFLDMRTHLLKENINRKVNSDYCGGCWMRYLCVSCPAENIIANNDINMPSKMHCIFRRIVIETILKEIVSIQENKVKYTNLLDNLHKFSTGNITEH